MSHGESNIGDQVQSLQARLLEQMALPGARRMTAVQQLAEAEEELKPLVVEAVRAGIVQRRIMEVTGLSSPTITRWARGHY